MSSCRATNAKPWRRDIEIDGVAYSAEVTEDGQAHFCGEPLSRRGLLELHVLVLDLEWAARGLPVLAGEHLNG